MSRGKSKTDIDNGLTFPIDNKGEEIKPYAKKIMEFREGQKLHDLQKITVTEYSWDHWYAQTFGLDINDLPTFCPPQLGNNKGIYTRLRDQYGYKSSLGTKKTTIDEDADDGEEKP